MLGYPMCTNFDITKLFVDYMMHSSFAYRQFNSNFTCGDPTIFPYDLNNGTISQPKSCHCWSQRCLPRAWQVFDVFASRPITLTPPENGAPCETLLSIQLFKPAINL
ncbi:hypothetical protein AVEN_166900-1 [Araneus ventricosus]|uniref:Uncharacterized protein n=1 Tax=Araneus ventricosus TaxID=182803 RepID=A0A4Y2ERB8_ARAVE|nr:hypothetical protein AVEN_166900-1 [Araneus ventricosus]